MKRPSLLARTVATLLMASGVLSSRAVQAQLVALPESSNVVGVLEKGETYLEFGFSGWGPNWQWLGFRGEIDEAGRASRLTNTATIRGSGARVSLDVKVQKTGARQLQCDVELRTDKDTDVTTMIISVELPQRSFATGEARIGASDGTKTIKLPLGRRVLGEQVGQFALVDGAGRQSKITLEPACDLTADGAARIVLADQHVRADRPVRVTMTIELPEDVTYYAGRNSLPEAPDFATWYPFRATTDYNKPSEFDMSHWLDSPAGAHGRILRQDDRLMYNGRPVKLWGLNVCYSSCAPDRELADRRAQFYAKYGINTVRLHKYADGAGWAGIQSKGSFVEFDAEALDRMDYFVAALKKRGIYVLLSSTFGVKLGPDDRRSVPYMDEFGKDRNRVSTGHGSVFLAHELQDLQIRQVVLLLRHKNPYTGQTYAEDPAVAVVELFNEDSALFFGTLSQLQKVPTLRKRAAELFCDWLEQRYGSEQALLKAWGKEALNSFGNEGLTGESWQQRTIVPAGNPWFFDPEQLAGSQKPKRQRLLDTMRFLYEIQNDFYARYVAALRDAGYEGEILGSNWQAGRAMSHYYNLHSDALVGMIDRHNYFGGGSGGKINNVTMLRIPGSGMLSAGMQQVADRPFMLSEWIHVLPNEWGVEGPAIIGAYGMGLQGWDVSYMFQNRDNGGFLKQLGGQWEVSAPQVLGLFPAVSRQVLREDVAESEVVATRYVHLPSLSEGRLGFEDRVTQQHDVKTFDSDKVPVETLAVARSVVAFSDEARGTPPFDLDAYRQQSAYVSSNGTLRWQPGQSKLDGYFTINSAATKAVVGFAEDTTCELDEVSITPHSRFAAIYVTALEREANLERARNVLVTAIARARNTGMKVFNDSRILDRGREPILMEPVKATIAIRRADKATVHVLDHDGCRTGATLPVRNGQFVIDGARDKTCYYLVTY